MKSKLLKILSIFAVILLMGAVFSGCGSSDDEIYDDSEAIVEEDAAGEDSAQTTGPSIWYGTYTSETGSVEFLEYPDTPDAVGCNLLSQVDGSTSTLMLVFDASNPTQLSDTDLIFTLDQTAGTVTVENVEGSAYGTAYLGVYTFSGAVEDLADTAVDVAAPESIDAWYGSYTSDVGTLVVESSIDNMVDYTLESNDGYYMSGTWTASETAGLGVMEDRELIATFNVDDGSVTISGQTEEDAASNASFIGTYYPG